MCSLTCMNQGTYMLWEGQEDVGVGFSIPKTKKVTLVIAILHQMGNLQWMIRRPKREKPKTNEKIYAPMQGFRSTSGASSGILILSIGHFVHHNQICKMENQSLLLCDMQQLVILWIMLMCKIEVHLIYLYFICSYIVAHLCITIILCKM